MGLIIGLVGTELSDAERAWLKDPSVAGLILFSRNFAARAQLLELVASARSVRKNLLICVDQEGGRVQRFREEFVALPALAELGALYGRSQARARRATALHAKVMTLDILACGIDLSFSPVVDLARGNLAIADRAFHADPAVCAQLSALYAATMQAQGMAATLKHFPGHGSVLADTHHDLAVDARPAAAILREDLLPFATAIEAQARAVMAAHVSFPAISADAAGYSERWLKVILREQLGFTGVVFSDDIGMSGGSAVGTLAQRVHLHYQAGCDLILVCSPEATAEVMAQAIGRKPARKVYQQLRAKRFGRARRIIAGQRFAGMVTRLNQLLSEP